MPNKVRAGVRDRVGAKIGVRVRVRFGVHAEGQLGRQGGAEALTSAPDESISVAVISTKRNPW